MVVIMNETGINLIFWFTVRNLVGRHIFLFKSYNYNGYDDEVKN